MEIFGKDWVGTPAAGDTPWIEVPVGARCIHCEEPIAPEDSGALVSMVTVGEDGQPMATTGASHRCCLIRSIVGSVAHQRRRCSCFGGTEGDPPELSRRQAAQAATDLFETRGGR